MKWLLQFIPINDVAAFLVGKAWRVDDPRILAALTDSLRSRDNIDDMGRFFAFNVRRADPKVVAEVKKAVSKFDARAKKWKQKDLKTAQLVNQAVAAAKPEISGALVDRMRERQAFAVSSRGPAQ